MAFRWFDSIGGSTYHNLSIFVCWLLRSVRIVSSTTPTTARRGTRFELLDGRQKTKTITITITVTETEMITITKNPLNPWYPMLKKNNRRHKRHRRKDNHQMNQMNRMKRGEQQITRTARMISVICEIRF